MKKILLPLLLILILTYSCNNQNSNQKKVDKLTFTNNCESIRGFSENYGYSSEYAYSGNYSNLLDTAKPYGVTFREKLNKLSNKGISKVRLSAQGYCLNPLANCFYCVSVDLDGKNLFWGELQMKNYVKNPKTWMLINGEITLPKNLDLNSTVSIFAWNKEKEPYFVDDYEFQFFE